jgi:hypothetical protein
MAHIKRVESAASVLGRRVSAAELIARVKTFSWKESLIRLSHLAALVANSPDGPCSPVVRACTVNALLDLTGEFWPVSRIKLFVLQNPDMAIAHEEAINYLQHLVLLAGGKEERMSPGDAELALWLLAINDHLDQWEEPDSRELSNQEKLIASNAHALRLNNFPDWLREMVRSYAIFSKTPSRGPFAGTEAWKQLQEAAFGCAFEDYFLEFVLRIAGTARLLGDRSRPEGLPIDMVGQLMRTGLSRASAQQWLEELSVTREAACRELSARIRENGLPYAPTVLLKHPIVDCGDGQLVCVSPWAIRGLLRAGIWARYLTAAKQRCGSDERGGKEWLSTFGDLFEEWCRDVAEHASKAKWFKGALLLPSYPGAQDEIEDIVLVEGRVAVLFSIKARFVPEKWARQARSRTGLMDWYQEFFFAKADKEHRRGAVSLLSRRIDWIRAGRFEPQLDRKMRIIPVILTYDSLCEHVLLYRWIRDRCKDEGVLQQKDVAPLTLARIEEFEELMRLASEGKSVVGALRKREQSFKDRRLDELLFAIEGRVGKPKRLPFLSRIYGEIFGKLEARISDASSEE